MATLGKIRSKSVLLFIVVIVALLAFILGDLISSGGTYFSESKANVGQVNGDNIKVNQFFMDVNQRTEVYKIEMGEAAISDEVSDGIRQEVWENIIRQNIILKETKAIGMVVSHAELREMVMGNNINPIILSRPMFAGENGMFDKNNLLQFLTAIDSEEVSQNMPADQLAALKNYWRFIEDFVSMNRLEQKYTTLLSKVMVPNSLDAKNAHAGNSPVVDIIYAMKPYFFIADSAVSVTEKELKALYNKNLEQYKQEASCDLNYVTFAIVPSQEDYASVEASINELKEEFTTATAEEADLLTDYSSDIPYNDVHFSKNDISETFQDFAFTAGNGAVMGPVLVNNSYQMARVMSPVVTLPDSVKLRRIVIADNTLMNSQAKADSLINVLKNGSSFELMAMQYSADQQSARMGGDIGWVREVLLDKDIASAVFAAKAGVPFQLTIGNSVQIFEVTEIGPLTPKVKLAVIALTVTPSNKTQSQIFQQAKQFASEATNVTQFNAVAKEKGYNVVPALNTNANAARLGNISYSRQVIRWAMENSEDAVSDVFECDNQLIVATLIRNNEAGYRSFEDVKDLVTAEARKIKKGELLTQEMTGKSFEAVLSNPTGLTTDTLKGITFNTPYAGSLGNEPTLFGIAPYTSLDATSAPITANMGVYIFKVINKIDASTPFNDKEETAILKARIQGIIPYYAIEALKNAADIKDQRYLFF